MKIVRRKRVVFISALLFFLFIFNTACKNGDIKGLWDVRLRYINISKKNIIPEKSVFEYAKNGVFYVNGKKRKGRYKKKGDYIRVLIKKRGYVVRGELIDSNTIKGELKKVITDEVIATWIAKRRNKK